MRNIRELNADIAIIGAGSGGLSAAAGAAMLGLKVVIFEKHEMGGDCLNYGCVPSKALLSAAKMAQSAREAAKYGVEVSPPRTDWEAVKAHIRHAIETIAPVDSQERFEGLGVTVIRESARFIDPKTVGSDSVRVKARRIIVATGSAAFIPPIPGLNDAPYITNETIFSLPEFPSHLVILGGGPIGLEMAQAFRRLGAAVTVIEMGRALARADAAHAAIAVEALRAEGVTLLEGHKAGRVSHDAGRVTVVVEADGAEKQVTGSHLLVALGRRAVLKGLELEAGNVAHDPNGLIVGDNLRSKSNPRVWALGDSAGQGQFTHLAGWHASVFIRRALFKQRSLASSLPLPSVTYLSPEVAQLALTEAEAKEKFGSGVTTTTFPFHENDRAIAEGKTLGEAKLVLNKGKLVGASIVGEGAGDILQLVSVAMSNGLKLTALTNFISPYPTRAEVVKRAASAHFTPTVFGKPARTLVGLLQRIA
jgi:pyruvate/2-oxoglutarate dehydrogenase complex dihydrolipoamide dehydrogenase (E3) component